MDPPKLTFSVDAFPNVYLNAEVWFNVGSNFQCINILGIIGDTKWTEGVIEISPLTCLSVEVHTKLIGTLLGQFTIIIIIILLAMRC